jgi:hypothetical protein
MFDQGLLADENAPPGKTSFDEEGTAKTSVGQRVPWDTALVGALPFLLFGLTYLLDGFAELGGHNPLAFHLLDRSLDLPAIILAPQMGVYLLSALGLLIGVLMDFPRWSYSYLGMSLYFGWYYSNGRFYGVEFNSWAWLPPFAAVILGLLLTRSLRPLARLLQSAWNDWTRLSFSLYAFALPMLTIIFFEEDWGAFQLYGLVFDSRSLPRPILKKVLNFALTFRGFVAIRYTQWV